MMETKVCTKCGRTKAAEEFGLRRKGGCELRTWCKLCCLTYKQGLAETRKAQLAAQTAKICPGCNTNKPIEQFGSFSHKQPASKFFFTYCISCRKKRRARELRQNPGRRLANRKIQIKRLYGLDWESYQELLTGQGGKCLICEKIPAEDERCLAVDHDHKTSTIRGLLCITCNAGLEVYEQHRQRVKDYLKED